MTSARLHRLLHLGELDTNLLIALLWPGHERHDVALKWFSRHRAKGWATCPITQAGFVRIVSNPAFSRDAVQPREAIHVLAANTAAKNHAYWPDELPVAEAVAFTGVRLMGHQQVTDGCPPAWPRPSSGRRAGHAGPTHRRAHGTQVHHGSRWNRLAEDC
jgi:toxin-antitoxin system PIN domain toxin